MSRVASWGAAGWQFDRDLAVLKVGVIGGGAGELGGWVRGGPSGSPRRRAGAQGGCELGGVGGGPQLSLAAWSAAPATAAPSCIAPVAPPACPHPAAGHSRAQAHERAAGGAGGAGAQHGAGEPARALVRHGQPPGQGCGWGRMLWALAGAALGLCWPCRALPPPPLLACSAAPSSAMQRQPAVRPCGPHPLLTPRIARLPASLPRAASTRDLRSVLAALLSPAWYASVARMQALGYAMDTTCLDRLPPVGGWVGGWVLVHGGRTGEEGWVGWRRCADGFGGVLGTLGLGAALHRQCRLHAAPLQRRAPCSPTPAPAQGPPSCCATAPPTPRPAPRRRPLRAALCGVCARHARRAAGGEV